MQVALETSAEIAAWCVAVALMLCGLVGTLIPIIPGTFLVLLAAGAFRLIHGADAGIGWVGFVVMTLLFALSALLEFLSGAAGAHWFGSSRWGALGALVGGIVGIFFGILGIFVGPIVGAVAFELLFAKKKIGHAGKSGFGTLVGTGAGMAIKFSIAMVMIIYFFSDVLYIDRF